MGLTRANTWTLNRVGRGAVLVALSCGPPTALHADARAERSAGGAPSCVYVSSYHVGYTWSDRIEAALIDGLGEACRLETFRLDAKRVREDELVGATALAAAERIAELEPDVLIVSDDAAMKWLVAPRLLDPALPVVFAGVNWTIEEYVLPDTGITGMIEVAPVDQMIEQATRAVPGARRAAYVGADVLTERKNYERTRRAAAARNVQLDAVYAADMPTWLSAFDAAQEYDFLVVGSAAGVHGWDDGVAAAHARRHTRRLAVTVHDWMMGVSGVGFTKVPAEQGRWAADCAREILAGLAPERIPFVTNREVQIWRNPVLEEAARAVLPASLLQRARLVESDAR